MNKNGKTNKYVKFVDVLHTHFLIFLCVWHEVKGASLLGLG